jgi:hypothetical protein
MTLQAVQQIEIACKQSNILIILGMISPAQNIPTFIPYGCTICIDIGLTVQLQWRLRRHIIVVTIVVFVVLSNVLTVCTHHQQTQEYNP